MIEQRKRKRDRNVYISNFLTNLLWKLTRNLMCFIILNKSHQIKAYALVWNNCNFNNVFVAKNIFKIRKKTKFIHVWARVRLKILIEFFLPFFLPKLLSLFVENSKQILAMLPFNNIFFIFLNMWIQCGTCVQFW